MISILNYGAGNANSVIRMVQRAGGQAESIQTVDQLLAAEKLIIPGVGAFDHCISQLVGQGLVESLNEVVIEKNIPVLGICMGMQMMCNGSEEGTLPGLGWIDADVRRFSFQETQNQRIPHMGWNTVSVQQANPLLCLEANGCEPRFYFVHSYHVVCRCAEDVVGTASYGSDFVCAFRKKNIFGVQFHPEKSHRYGLELLKRFVEF